MSRGQDGPGRQAAAAGAAFPITHGRLISGSELGPLEPVRAEPRASGGRLAHEELSLLLVTDITGTSNTRRVIEAR
jgi:hypothetical protein